ncbi:MAG: histone deacetylase family protein [Promethearchaeota archaeon]
MKFIYSPRFNEGEYSHDPAATRERFDSIASVLMQNPSVLEPVPATLDDLLRAHSESHVNQIMRDENLFEIASLAAGGAIMAAKTATTGEPAFAAIRPPGHHASRDSAWGFCFFNNIAIAILKLIADGNIHSAFILDFDLHTGDGNINILSNNANIRIFNPDASSRKEYLEIVENRLNSEHEYDIIAVSAGFDQYIQDWGGLLKTSDFKALGRLVKAFSIDKCKGRRFAILEGGYNYGDLGKNMMAFCDGLA